MERLKVQPARIACEVVGCKVKPARLKVESARLERKSVRPDVEADRREAKAERLHASAARHEAALIRTDVAGPPIRESPVRIRRDGSATTLRTLAVSRRDLLRDRHINLTPA